VTGIRKREGTNSLLEYMTEMGKRRATTRGGGKQRRESLIKGEDEEKRYGGF